MISVNEENIYPPHAKMRRAEVNAFDDDNIDISKLVVNKFVNRPDLKATT